MENKPLWILSAVIGAVFLIIVISLAVADKIQTTALIVFTVIILLAVFLIDMSFYIVNKKRGNDLEVEHKKIKIISKDDARKIVEEMLMDTNISEYEDECLYEDIWHMGESKTPIYIKCVRGKFEGNLYGIIINMENAEKQSIKEYIESKVTETEIEIDIEKRANFIAVSPRPTPSSEEEVIEKTDGTRLTRKRILTKSEQDSKSIGGLS